MIAYIIKLLPSLFDGLATTFYIFAITLVLSLPLGVVIAVLASCKIKAVKALTEIYIWLMRGTPLLLQIVFIFFGLPIIGITFNRSTAALIAFVLNYGAYFGEIFRGGIDSMDKGQYEAIEVLNFSPFKGFTRIIFPQVVKRVIPPVANEVITLIKDTALVYVVGLDELLRVAKIASNRDVSLAPLAIAGLIYLLLIAVLTRLFKALEKRYSYYD